MKRKARFIIHQVGNRFEWILYAGNKMEMARSYDYYSNISRCVRSINAVIKMLRTPVDVEYNGKFLDSVIE